MTPPPPDDRVDSTDGDDVEEHWDHAMADVFGGDFDLDAPDEATEPTIFQRLAEAREDVLGTEGSEGSAIGQIGTVHLDENLLEESAVIDPGTGAHAVGNSKPRRCGRYLVLGEIARGGVGVILQARDLDLGRDIAIKVLREKWRDHSGLIKRFVEEAQVGGQLQHPGICPVYELGLDQERHPFFTMKLVRGKTLSRELSDRQGLLADRPRLLAIFTQVCQTLAYAHARKVVHRDLKPSNIMIGGFGETLVMDFGMAKILGQGGVNDERLAKSIDEVTQIATVRTEDEGSQSLPGSVLGTPSYMPPEQASGQVGLIDERADVFSLGAILCEILTGSPPYTRKVGSSVIEQAAQASLEEAWDRLESSDADEDLLRLCRNCLHPDLSLRPRHAGLLAEAMESWQRAQEQRALAAREEALASRVAAAGERKARRLTMALAGSILLLVLGGGGVWIAGQRSMKIAQEANADKVGDGLFEVRRLIDKGQLSGARQRLESVTELLEEGVTPDGLMKLKATLQSQLEFRKRNDEILHSLARIRTQSQEDIEADRGAYEAAFSEYGVDVLEMEPAEAGRALKEQGKEILAELALALDDWAARSHQLRQRQWSHILDTAQAVDPQPIREALRAALSSDDRQSLVSLARTVDPLKSSIGTLHLLSLGLLSSGQRVWGIKMLKAGCHMHPDAFWLHYLLGSELAGNGRSRGPGGGRGGDPRHPRDRDGRPSPGRGPRRMRPDERIEAAVHLGTALALRPRSPFVVLQYVQLLISEGKIKSAEEVMSAAVLRDGNDPVIRLAEAHVMMERSDFRSALSKVEGVLSEDPLNAIAIRLRRNLRRRRGADEDDPRVQFELLTQEVVAHPEDASLKADLADALLRLCRFDLAADMATQAVEQDPGDGSAWQLLGRAQLQNGEYRKAIAAFDAAKKARRSASGLDKERELAETLQRQLPAYEQWRALDRGRRAPRFTLDFARIAFHSGEMDIAAELFRSLLSEQRSGGPGFDRPRRRRGERPRGPGLGPGAPMPPASLCDAACALVAVAAPETSATGASSNADLRLALRCLEDSVMHLKRDQGGPRLSTVALLDTWDRWMHDPRLESVRRASVLQGLPADIRGRFAKGFESLKTALKGAK